MIKRLFLGFVVISFITGQSTAVAGEGKLSYLINGKKPVKVFVKGFVNESGQSQILPEEFKDVFEKALTNRRSVKFIIVDSAQASAIQISGVIKKYLYSETDPVKTSVSPITLLLDASTTENYAEMTVAFNVIDTKTAKAVWDGEIKDYVKHPMTPKDSIGLVSNKVSRTFLWKSFGKIR